MGISAQVIAGRVTNAAAVVTSVTPNSGDSLQVASFATTSAAYLENLWASQATAGVVRVKSPQMHDQAQGLRLQSGDTQPRLLMPDGARQPLYTGEILDLAMTGGAAEVDVAAMLLTYDDRPGIAANLAAWSEVQGRVQQLAGVEVDGTTSATAGDWNAGRAINADFNNLKAGVNYAVLGYTVSAKCAVVALQGPATGNVRLGGPGSIEAENTRSYFVDVAEASGKPFIPIINGSDAGATLLYLCDPATAAAVHVSLLVAQLSS